MLLIMDSAWTKTGVGIFQHHENYLVATSSCCNAVLIKVLGTWACGKCGLTLITPPYTDYRGDGPSITIYVRIGKEFVVRTWIHQWSRIPLDALGVVFHEDSA